MLQFPVSDGPGGGAYLQGLRQPPPPTPSGPPLPTPRGSVSRSELQTPPPPVWWPHTKLEVCRTFSPHEIVPAKIVPTRNFLSECLFFFADEDLSRVETSTCSLGLYCD